MWEGGAAAREQKAGHRASRPVHPLTPDGAVMRLFRPMRGLQSTLKAKRSDQGLPTWVTELGLWWNQNPNLGPKHLEISAQTVVE